MVPIARPSPLSRLNPSPQPPLPHGGSHAHIHAMSSHHAASIHRPTSHHGQPTYEPSQKSPCFIHSHLEKHGQLSEWLRAKADTAGSRLNGSADVPSRSQPGDRTDVERQGLSTPSQPVPITHHRAAGPSDHRPSFGNSLVPSGNLSDTEDGGSLTRQLAETATGVREMSKQLGESRCLRCRVTSPTHAITSSARPHQSPLQHPNRPHRHESSRQPPHQAHPRVGHLFDDQEATEWGRELQ